MAFSKRDDPWNTLTIQRFDPICAHVASDFELDELTVHKIYSKNGNSKGQRIAFVYESEEEDLSKIIGRVVARAKLQHHTER